MKAAFGTGAAPTPGEPTARGGFTPPSVAEVGQLFPQLEVVELLGQGGMGAVYKARQPALDRWVALKVLPPQTAAKADFSERFNREARALARLSHPHIVAVHEFGQAGGLPYFIMEYVDGVTLRQLVQTGKLAPEQALAIVPQICEALQFAHDEGIVHRDIKPENILLDMKGRVKIADFGIAKLVEGDGAGRQPITQDQQMIGTPHYMAPEQVEKPHRVDHRADIYSLGVVFYEMLTGELPLGKFAPPSRKVQVDVRLDEVVLHALEKEPERRYQQAREVKTEVETIVAARDRVAPASRLTRRRKRALVGGIVTLLLLALLLGALLWPSGVQLEGMVVDAVTGRPIPNAVVKRFSSRHDTAAATSVRTSPEGRFMLDMGKYSSSKEVRVSAEGYAAVQATLGSRRFGQRRLSREFRLEPLAESAFAVSSRSTAPAVLVGAESAADVTQGFGGSTAGAVLVGAESVLVARQIATTYETVPVTRGALAMVVMEAGRLSPSSHDPSQWQVTANLPETSVAHIEVGHEVDCLADAFPHRGFKGKVTSVDGTPAPGLEPPSYKAVVLVTNPGLRFRDGMSVRLAFLLAHRPDALRIPVQALLFQMPGSPSVSVGSPFGLPPSELAMADAAQRAARTVWVLRTKNEPEPVRIRIGITDGTFTEVVAGLGEGERVVISQTKGNSRTQSDLLPTGPAAAAIPELEIAAETGKALAPPNAAGAFAPAQSTLTQPSPWANPNLSAGLATLVWRALAEPLASDGERHLWLSTTTRSPACVVNGVVSHGTPSERNDTRQGEAVTLYFVSVEEAANPQVCGARVEVGKPFEIRNLPAGKYHVIAIANPTPEGLFDEIGVPTEWRILDATVEKPIEGLTVQMSPALTSSVRRSFRFDTGLSHLNSESIKTDSLGPHGRVLDHEGSPLRGAEIQVREFAPPDDVEFAAPDTRANYEGYYGLPPLAFRYSVCANACQPLRDAIGVRWQTLRRERILAGKQRVDFAFPRWPADAKGGGRIKGSVTDRAGQPLSGWVVDVRPDKVWPKITETSDGWFNQWGIRVPVDQGEFTAGEVPVGGCVLRLLNTNGAEREARLVEIQPGTALSVHFVVEPNADPATVPAASTGKGGGASWTFSAVIERQVGDDNPGQGPSFLDFDVGNLFSPPPALQPSKDPKALEKWMVQEGVDALGETAPDIRGLVGFDMIVIPVLNVDWDTLKPSAVAEQLQHGKLGTPAVMSGKGELPATYLLETREGGQGIMQILGFTDQPRGIRIRYKLLKQSRQ
jgi:multidrug efflux pump subunit AcrA (membrane-fusion protein)/predicted Ser/Thr protein kinase